MGIVTEERERRKGGKGGVEGETGGRGEGRQNECCCAVVCIAYNNPPVSHTMVQLLRAATAMLLFGNLYARTWRWGGGRGMPNPLTGLSITLLPLMQAHPINKHGPDWWGLPSP